MSLPYFTIVSFVILSISRPFICHRLYRCLDYVFIPQSAVRADRMVRRLTSGCYGNAHLCVSGLTALSTHRLDHYPFPVIFYYLTITHCNCSHFISSCSKYPTVRPDTIIASSGGGIEHFRPAQYPSKAFMGSICFAIPYISSR